MGIENRRFIFHIMMMLENNLQGLILMHLTKSFYVDESPAQKLERLALGKIAQLLRNAGALFNKTEVSPSYLGKLTEFCTLYFNLYAIFFFIRC